MEHKNLESGLGFKVGLGESLQAGEREGEGKGRRERTHKHTSRAQLVQKVLLCNVEKGTPSSEGNVASRV